MKKLKYLVFIFVCSLFMVSGVSAESKYYEFVKLENNGYYHENNGGMEDALEIDSGFLVLSTEEDGIIVYDSEGNRKDFVALTFDPKSFIAIDGKNYIVGYNYDNNTYSKDVKIVELKSDLTTLDVQYLNGGYLDFDCYFEKGEYIYFHSVNIGDLIFKMKKDFSSIERVSIKSLSEEEKTLLSDYLYAAEQGSIFSTYDGGFIYSYSVLEDDNYKYIIAYYKNGQVIWEIDELSDEYIYDIAEVDGNLLILTVDAEKEGEDYIIITKLYTISDEGKFLEEYDVSEYFYGISDNYKNNANMPFISEYKIKIADNFMFIVGPAIESQKNGDEGYDFFMYFKKKTPEVEDEKVPETADNVYSYLVMLTMSGLVLTTLSYKKRYN